MEASKTQQKDKAHKIGKNAELEACYFLQSHGFRLLHQNYRCFYGEIDLIMQDQNSVVFVEVRCRSRLDYGTPAETVNRCKRMKLIKTATHFLQKKAWLHKVTSRFDIVSIHLMGPGSKNEIRWLKNAFTND